MLTVPPSMVIYVYTEVADLRKGCHGLSGIVREQFDADPTDGSLFLFFNRRRDRLKILHWDGTGFWLYYKLLEVGTFESLAPGANRDRVNDKCLRIDATALAMLLGGVQLATARRRKRYQAVSPNAS